MTEIPQTLTTVLDSYNNRPGSYLGPPLEVLQHIVFTEVSNDPQFPTLAKQLSETIISRASIYMHHKAWTALISSSLAILGGTLENELCKAGLAVSAGILCAIEATGWYKGYQYRSFANDLLLQIKNKG